MKNNLSHIKVETFKRSPAQTCDQGHRYIPVNNECLICKNNVSPTVQSMSEEEDSGRTEQDEKEGTSHSYDFTRKRVYKL